MDRAVLCFTTDGRRGSGAAPTVLATIRPVRLGQNMGVLVVIVIDEEAAIAAAIKMLRAFHEQGALTLYSVAAIARQGGVGAVLREPVGRNEASAAPSVGAAVGTLLSVLEGPLNAATKAGGRGLIGAVRDLGDVGLDAGFLEQVSRDLNVGGGAIVAEMRNRSRSRSKVLPLPRGRGCSGTGSPAP